MIITTSDHEHKTTVLAFHGRFDFQARHPYQEAIGKALATSPLLVVLDFSDVPYIDSAGLGLLTLTHKKLSEAGIHMALAHPQEFVKRILNLANMGKLFPIHNTLPAAIRSQTSPAPS